MRRPRRSGGFATITAVLLLSMVFAFAVLLSSVVLSGRRAERAVADAVSAEQLAEAGIARALSCINATTSASCGASYGSNYAGESNVALGNGAFTVTVTGSGAARTAISTGTTATGKTAAIKTDFTTDPEYDNPSFSYALQAGAHGVHMENNSTVSGTVYANGSIDCTSTNAVITGDAYVALADGSISSCKVQNDAHADRILNSKVLKDAYYRNDPADISGTTVTGTKHSGSATPTAGDMPQLDLQFWHDSAEAGGVIYGDYAPANGSTLGPIKITGNLTLSQNVSVTVKGGVWVMGNIQTQNNSALTLDPSFGPYGTVILADDPDDHVNHGKITIVNNTSISGSGNAKSYILLASTNNSTDDAAPAVSVANNASGVIFYALSGVLRLQNLAGAKALASDRLFLDQNAAVTYAQSNFAGAFANSPGGAWRIQADSWRKMQ